MSPNPLSEGIQRANFLATLNRDEIWETNETCVLARPTNPLAVLEPGKSYKTLTYKYAHKNWNLGTS
ncbi:hypothetical protein HanXRQr2_Chr17g0782781 [Helianthus annuus]|uniref:Uncharacterized protein n=1 Tax=Helianthus annuus TaxID=4232 RepID=A0A9K3DEJ7_HELAN|nr:hypothetical protein HanXRQr2_Chr17g0782781 [Helianthus annuus]